MEVSIQFALLIPVVVGLVEIVKGVKIPDRFLPIISILFGLILTWILGEFNILQGLIVGLSASGLYKGTKTVAGM